MFSNPATNFSLPLQGFLCRSLTDHAPARPPGAREHRALLDAWGLALVADLEEIRARVERAAPGAPNAHRDVAVTRGAADVVGERPRHGRIDLALGGADAA